MSSNFRAVITQEGINKALSADKNGLSAEISHVGISSTGFSPGRSTSKIPDELFRVKIADGAKKAPGQLHLTCILEQGEYEARSVGFYLSDGTLFAVWSHPSNVLFYKTAGARIIQAFDLVLEAVPVEAVVIKTEGDLSLYYAPEFMELTIAQTRNSASAVDVMHRQITLNNRLLRAGV